MALRPDANAKIDRTTTPPFHLRMYYRHDEFHSPHEFSTVPPPSSLQKKSLIIYTWSDATLSELTSLLTSALPDLLPDPAAGTRIGYKLIFPDTRSIQDDSRGRWTSKPFGSVILGGQDDDNVNVNDNDTKMGGDADMTLADARFVIGDYISCAVLPPLSDGSVAPLPLSTDRPPLEPGRLGPPAARYGASGGGVGYRGGRNRDRPNVPHGDWQRGERIPDGPGFVSAGGRGRD